jgi:hypothetical protein
MLRDHCGVLAIFVAAHPLDPRDSCRSWKEKGVNSERMKMKAMMAHMLLCNVTVYLLLNLHGEHCSVLSLATMRRGSDSRKKINAILGDVLCSDYFMDITRG